MIKIENMDKIEIRTKLKIRTKMKIWLYGNENKSIEARNDDRA